MADGIDQAAAAFETAIAGTPPPPTRKKDEEPVGKPTERLFARDKEVDDESPAKGGGDDFEDPEAIIYEDADGDSRRRDGKSKEGAEDDEDDGDGEAGEDGEKEAGSGDEEFLSQTVTVIVDGEEKEVALKEALDGYVRTETFHKRLNEVDEAKKIVQRCAADAVQNFKYTMELGKEMEGMIEALVPKEPDWDQEFQKNPGRARELQKYYEQVKRFRGDMKAKLEEASKKQQESDNVQLQAFAEAEGKKFDQMNSKNWATDPKKKQKDIQAMRRTALASGFSEEEVSQVYDSRMLQVLLKASKYDRMMAARPKPVQQNRSKPIAPGTGSARQRTVHRGVSSAMKRLNQTGSIEDAANVFDEILRR